VVTRRFCDLQARDPHDPPRHAGPDTGAPDPVRQKARGDRVTAGGSVLQTGTLRGVAPVQKTSLPPVEYRFSVAPAVPSHSPDGRAL